MVRYVNWIGVLLVALSAVLSAAETERRWPPGWADAMLAAAATDAGVALLLDEKSALQEELVTCAADCAALRWRYRLATERFNAAVNAALGLPEPYKAEKRWRAWCMTRRGRC